MDPIIYEDEPGWDCATMGNLICGPDYLPDTALVTEAPLTGIGVVLVLIAAIITTRIKEKA